MSDETRIWLVVVPLDCDAPGAVLPVSIRSVHRAEANAQAAAKRINRFEGRRSEDCRAFVESYEVRP